MNVKRADLSRFDGQDSAEDSPAHRLTVFSKVKGVIIDARSSCAQSGPVYRALKRLKNKLDSEGILEEVRRLRAFETPSQKHRRKARANAKRARMKFRFNA